MRLMQMPQAASLCQEFDAAAGCYQSQSSPVANNTTGVLWGLEPVTMRTLFFQRPNHPFHHAVLLRAIRRDELLLPTVATN